MNVIICGARDWDEPERIHERIAQLSHTVLIVTGGAKGADTIADESAKNLGFDRIICPANWTRCGRGAGPIRNRRMLDLFEPELVIAFRRKESKGTANMLEQAKKAGYATETHYADEQ